MSQRLRSQPMWVDVLECFACRQAHFLEKFAVSGVAVQLFEQWIAFDLRESGVALFIGILEPFKWFVGFLTEGIHLSDTVGPGSAIPADKIGSSRIRIRFPPDRVLSKYITV